jgi:hypothetical protein
MVDLEKPVDKGEAKNAFSVGKKQVERGMKYMQEMAAKNDCLSS